ncbi:hypothetical protein H310_02248, partial [Aphanomyces invadans]
MFHHKNVVHAILNESDPIGQVVPIVIYISQESDLTWFNETSPDPTYFEQIVERLQSPDEWPAVRAQVLALDQPTTKKVDATGLRECVLPRIKFAYEVRRNSRGYNVLLSQSKSNFAPRSMASFEVAVWCFPNDTTVNASSPSRAASLPSPLPNAITIDDD